MAMVTRANRDYAGIGGHISTFASSATLYEVGFNHFFRGRGETATTATRFISRATRRPACTRGRFWKAGSPSSNLINFRRELQPKAAGCRPIRIPG